VTANLFLQHMKLLRVSGKKVGNDFGPESVLWDTLRRPEKSPAPKHRTHNPAVLAFGKSSLFSIHTPATVLQREPAALCPKCTGPYPF
jgi:hypothetical protein